MISPANADWEIEAETRGIKLDKLLNKNLELNEKKTSVELKLSNANSLLNQYKKPQVEVKIEIAFEEAAEGMVAVSCQTETISSFTAIIVDDLTSESVSQNYLRNLCERHRVNIIKASKENQDLLEKNRLLKNAYEEAISNLIKIPEFIEAASFHVFDESE